MRVAFLIFLFFFLLLLFQVVAYILVLLAAFQMDRKEEVVMAALELPSCSDGYILGRGGEAERIQVQHEHGQFFTHRKERGRKMKLVSSSVQVVSRAFI